MALLVYIRYISSGSFSYSTYTIQYKMGLHKSASDGIA